MRALTLMPAMLLISNMAIGAEKCAFDKNKLQFKGSPPEQAACLLRPVGKWGQVGSNNIGLPPALAERIGKPVGSLKTGLSALLASRQIKSDAIGGSLDDPLPPSTRYFVIHDTSAPYLGNAATFPPDDAAAVNDLSGYIKPDAVAHVFVGRLGEARTGHDFKSAWRATKFENQVIGSSAKGMFLHVELVQPRRHDPSGGPKNDALAPQPGFTPAQYEHLAILYAAASARSGAWLIPAYHAVLDLGIADAHDDPQQFDLAAFADALSRLALQLGAQPGAPQAQAKDLALYRGLCDASAAVVLDQQHFVVADDESNILSIFRRDKPDAVMTRDLAGFLEIPPGEEADIEGAAAIGDRIYWITSHARTRKGKPAPERQRFFATTLKPGTPPGLEPVGKPYKNLLQKMLKFDPLLPYQLEAASEKAPKTADSLNIEGLAATADGTLLIGFRSPIRDGKALVLPLTNPQAVIDQGAEPAFGMPVELDLGGLGIRSMERIGASLLIVAGPATAKGQFALYKWSGRPGEPARPIPSAITAGWNPEALFAFPDGAVRIASDDGAELADQIECKKKNVTERAFRSGAVSGE